MSENERADKILLGIAVGALLLRAARGASVRAELETMVTAADRFNEAWIGAARRAIGCRKPNECECAICAEEKEPC